MPCSRSSTTTPPGAVQEVSAGRSISVTATGAAAGGKVRRPIPPRFAAPREGVAATFKILKEVSGFPEWHQKLGSGASSACCKASLRLRASTLSRSGPVMQVVARAMMTMTAKISWERMPRS